MKKSHRLIDNKLFILLIFLQKVNLILNLLIEFEMIKVKQANMMTSRLALMRLNPNVQPIYFFQIKSTNTGKKKKQEEIEGKKVRKKKVRKSRIQTTLIAFPTLRRNNSPCRRRRSLFAFSYQHLRVDSLLLCKIICGLVLCS